MVQTLVQRLLKAIDAKEYMKGNILLATMLLAVSVSAQALSAEELEPPVAIDAIESCNKRSHLILLEDRIVCGNEESTCLEFGHWVPWYLLPELTRTCRDIFISCNRQAERAHQARLESCLTQSNPVGLVSRLGEIPY